MKVIMWIMLYCWLCVGAGYLAQPLIDDERIDSGCITDTECMEMWGGDGYDG